MLDRGNEETYRADYDYLFKIRLIGDPGVGKSSLLLRFTDDSFTESFITSIGVDFKIKNLQIKDKQCKLQIFDTYNQNNNFRGLRNINKDWSQHCIFIVFDLTDPESFNNIQKHYEDCESHINDTIPIIIVGTKSDLDSERKVSQVDAQYFCDQLGLTYIETSAKNGHQVDKAFESATINLLRKFDNNFDSSYEKSLELEQKEREIFDGMVSSINKAFPQKFSSKLNELQLITDLKNTLNASTYKKLNVLHDHLKIAKNNMPQGLNKSKLEFFISDCLKKIETIYNKTYAEKVRKQISLEMSLEKSSLKSLRDALLLIPEKSSLHIAIKDLNVLLDAGALDDSLAKQISEDTLEIVKIIEKSPNLSAVEKQSAINTFLDKIIKSLPEDSMGMKIGRAIAVILIVAVCFLACMTIGSFIGFAAGAWSGPAAFLTAFIGMSSGFMIGLTIASSVAAAAAGGLTLYGLFSSDLYAEEEITTVAKAAGNRVLEKAHEEFAEATQKMG
ncbi:MAG: GTP-binding protein [Tatlockia sp.]|nr:GTP-binding protein [Tatlockia sp.]